jgi:hypothetical protein
MTINGGYFSRGNLEAFTAACNQLAQQVARREFAADTIYVVGPSALPSFAGPGDDLRQDRRLRRVRVIGEADGARPAPGRVRQPAADRGRREEAVSRRPGAQPPNFLRVSASRRAIGAGSLEPNEP